MSSGLPALRNRFLDPKVLARLGNLQLVAKTVVEGFVSGLHRSPFHGFSLDFVEYREYSPGDDIRWVDWKVYGRTDRFYVKKYEGDTNTRLYLVLDASRSMAFASHEVSKIDYARFLAACIAYFAVRQNDAVGLVTFDSGLLDFLPPRTQQGHFSAILHRLEKLRLGSETDITRATDELSRLIRRKSLVVLISDFYEEVESLVRVLRFFRHRGNDVILFHILDPAERELPFSEQFTLEDMETTEQIPYVPDLSRKAYLEALNRHIRDLRQRTREVFIDYQCLNTEEPLDEALLRYMKLREKRP